jgi:predicted ABC-type transport system involved in lysophospholipase L1 biosynthesis ATPase subunit
MDELLRLVSISKGYTRGERWHPVLQDVSLRVASREVVAVVGSRYEGKTTLLRIAAGFDRPDKGEVWVDGEELSSGSEMVRASARGLVMAWVHRGGSAVPLRVTDAVGLPLATGRGHGRREVRRMAAAALDRVGVSHCAAQNWADLSNWERVLVALARGIVGRPKLMLIDDLLDGLGPWRTQEAADLLTSLVDELGCGVLMSVSDMEGALAADRVFTFEQSRLRMIAGLPESNVVDLSGRRDEGRTERSA